LLDGTYIVLSGEKELAGDRIQTDLNLNGRSLSVDAVGVLGARWDSEGNLQALAAGGLRYWKEGTMDIQLSQPVDFAMWKDKHGNWQGLLQDHIGPVPDPLQSFTARWQRISSPLPISA